jgi:hypothetical protein
MTSITLENGAVVTVPEGATVSTDPVVRPETKITKLAFKKRMTQAERIAIREAAAVDAVVFDFSDLQESSKYVDLSDPILYAGLHAIEKAGVLSAGRADEIISAPVQEDEAWSGA